jgi:hypothetical protein
MEARIFAQMGYVYALFIHSNLLDRRSMVMTVVLRKPQTSWRKFLT